MKLEAQVFWLHWQVNRPSRSLRCQRGQGSTGGYMICPMYQWRIEVSTDEKPSCLIRSTEEGSASQPLPSKGRGAYEAEGMKKISIISFIFTGKYITYFLRQVISKAGPFSGYSKITCNPCYVAAVAEWYRHRIVAGFVTSSSPVPLKTRRVGQRCTLNPSRAETSSRWCGVVVRRGGASSGVVHVT
ncbi:uncharacterized protein TNCV_2724701 [Trichonephila clavipes]|nr:uncharacterized protein TNCV_2724701 [Trichonephila clavipes]